MALENKEEAKQQILDYAANKSKTKFYFNDFSKLFPDAKAREVKKLLTELVNEGKMEFWSSGSTTMYGVTGAGLREEG